MALVTNITKEVLIPNEDERAVIRKLSHIQLKEAAKIRRSEGIGFMRELGGELLAAMRDGDNEKIKKVEEAQAANVNNYDRRYLLEHGIVSWTYPIPPVAKKVDVGTQPPDGIDQQDESTAAFLAEQIFQFSRPETKEEAKNG